MSRQFFPEHQNCKCCKGFIYGCEGKSCKSLGHCVCTTMKTGSALGATKKRWGKYEIIRSPEQVSEQPRVDLIHRGRASPSPNQPLLSSRTPRRGPSSGCSTSSDATWARSWTRGKRLRGTKRRYFAALLTLLSLSRHRLASHSERRYLGNQLKMDPHDASEAFSLVAWRKSVLYVMLFLSVCIVGMDVVAVKKEFDYWGYLGEMAGGERANPMLSLIKTPANTLPCLILSLSRRSSHVPRAVWNPPVQHRQLVYV